MSHTKVISLAICSLFSTPILADTIGAIDGSITAGTNSALISPGFIGTTAANDSRHDSVYSPTTHTGNDTVVSSSTTTAQISPSGISVATFSDGSRYFQYPTFNQPLSILTSSGKITFNVNIDSTFSYAYNSMGSTDPGKIDLSNSSGASILKLSCFMAAPAGCDTSTNKTANGSIQLSAGLYTLSFYGTAEPATGTVYDSKMNFSMQAQPAATPLPAGLWLLISGLAPLYGFSRRKLPNNS